MGQVGHFLEYWADDGSTDEPGPQLFRAETNDYASCNDLIHYILTETQLLYNQLPSHISTNNLCRLNEH